MVPVVPRVGQQVWHGRTDELPEAIHFTNLARVNILVILDRLELISHVRHVLIQPAALIFWKNGVQLEPRLCRNSETLDDIALAVHSSDYIQCDVELL